jgi:GSH-dependent disulfide-bond oxidoreductase
MLKLYYHATPNSLKVAVLLNELHLPFDIEPIDIFKGEQHSPEFVAINPNAKVPALVDDEVTVFDSHAILLYLAEKHGAFVPRTAVEKAAMLSWLQLVATGLSPFSGQVIHFFKYAPEDIPYAKDRYAKELLRHYRVLNDRLARSEWLAGKDYTIADMALFGWINSAQFIFGEWALSEFSALERFLKTMKDRPAVQEALALRTSFQFKHDMDQASRKALFAHRS